MMHEVITTVLAVIGIVLIFYIGYAFGRTRDSQK